MIPCVMGFLSCPPPGGDGSTVPSGQWHLVSSLAASRSSGQSGPLQVEPYCSPESVCRLLPLHGLGNGLGTQDGRGSISQVRL